jgi:hypothetical protein
MKREQIVEMVLDGRLMENLLHIGKLTLAKSKYLMLNTTDSFASTYNSGWSKSWLAKTRACKIGVAAGCYSKN